jgi:hypothetical protein
MATINPFQGPINYAVDVQSPFEAALGGFRIGAVGAEAQARALEREDARIAREQARAVQEQARLAQEQFQAGLNSFFAKPAAERTFDELQPLLVGANKQQFDALKLIGESMSADKLNSSKRFTSQVLLAFEANPETAKTLIQDRINAETDPGQKRAFQDILTIADQNPEQAARLVESLGAGTFGKDWYEGITKVREERRVAAREPSALREAVAKADSAVADAERKLAEAADTPSRLAAERELTRAQTDQQRALTAASIGGEARAVAEAPDKLRRLAADADAAVADAQKKVAEATDTPARLQAEQNLRVAQAQKAQADARVAQATEPFAISEAKSKSIIKAAEAKFAPEKFGLEIGLTQSQIDQSKAARQASIAAAAKSGAEAKRAQLEADQLAAGVIPVEKRPETETKFRNEYNAQTKPFQEVKSAYGRVLSSEDTAVGDLSLIFGYMKMLDPGSVVREGEFATAQNATGVPERIQNIYNKVVSGERLNASQRNSFKGQAKKLYESAGEQETVVRQGLERIAKGYGLNTGNIFYTPVEVAPTGRSSTPANTVTVGGRTYTRPANFTDAQWNSYKQSVGAQ